MGFVSFDKHLLNDSQKTYKWKAIISQVTPQSVKSGAGGFLGVQTMVNRAVNSVKEKASQLSGGLIDSGIDINLPPITITQASLPSFDFDVDSIPQRGTQKKVPGGSTIGTLTLTFLEDVTGTVSRSLAAWRQLVYNPATGTFGVPGEYEADIIIQLLNDQNFVHTVYTLKGCWPATTAPIELSYETGDKVGIAQTFALQRVVIEKENLIDAILSGDIEDITASNLVSQLGSFASFV